MDVQVIRCRCGRVVGVLENGTLIVKKNGRIARIEGDYSAELVCERCRTITAIRKTPLT